MKAVIVEDHYSALQDLLGLLADTCPEIEVLGHTASEAEAIQLIRETKPDLVFLDIELQDGGNGFSVLEQLDQPQLQVIFVSAHGQFAVRAFRADNTVDFLQKPIEEQELRQAVDRALTERTLRQNDAQYRLWRDTIIHSKRARIALADQQRILFPYIDTIIHVKAEGTSSIFYFDPPQNKMMVTKNIGVYSKMAEEYPAIMMQVHRSHILNLGKVVEYQRSMRQAVLTNGEKVSVAADKFDEFLQRWSQANS
ncbi:MAG: response regulator transcription factor [Saprospiraceae bacterium]